MVSQKNVQTVKEVSEQLKKHPVIGIIDMFKLPASQLHQIRTMLRGNATIRMVKKSLMIRAFNDSGIKGIGALEEKLQGEPALILSEMNPFKLAMMVDRNKSEAPAKPGDIAPKDIEIKAGPTSLSPGPVIGDLQKAKIPASIEGDKIHVKQDVIVAREGDEINEILADVLSKLSITPMEIGLNLLAVWEDGIVYEKDILFVPQEKYVSDLVAAHQAAFNLACSAGFPTKDTVPLLLSKAHQAAFNLATEAGILTKETVKPLLAKAAAQADALKARTGVTDSPAPAEEPKEDSGEAPKESGDSESKADQGKSTEETPEKPAEEAKEEAAEKPDDKKSEEKKEGEEFTSDKEETKKEDKEKSK